MKARKQTRKYDSIFKKITDYHKDKVVLELKSEIPSYLENRKEYDRLGKSKKDIVDRIKESIQGAIFFSKVTEWADSSKPADYRTIDRFRENISELHSFKYPLKFHKQLPVRQTLEEDHQEFVRGIFNEKVIRQIISSIFYNNYKKKISEEHKKYRINVAKILIGYSSSELIRYIDPQYKRFLEADVSKAVGICKSVN